MISPFDYFAPFLIAFILTIILTPLIRRLAVKKNILDYPNESRKVHTKAVPLLGGWVIWLSFTLTVLFYSAFTDGCWVVICYGSILLALA